MLPWGSTIPKPNCSFFKAPQKPHQKQEGDYFTLQAAQWMHLFLSKVKFATGPLWSSHNVWLQVPRLPKLVNNKKKVPKLGFPSLPPWEQLETCVPYCGEPASAGGWTQRSLEIPSNPCYPMILWFLGDVEAHWKGLTWAWANLRSWGYCCMFSGYSYYFLNVYCTVVSAVVYLQYSPVSIRVVKQLRINVSGFSENTLRKNVTRKWKAILMSRFLLPSSEK